MKNSKAFIGEFIGTFILVFFGCGSVASATLFGAFSSLYEVAMVWFVGVSLAIYTANNFSEAHLNPAVSIGFVVAGKFSIKKLPIYILAQFLGAFFSAGLLYFIFSDFIHSYELAHQITRGTPSSIPTASLFGEFFPNPSFADKISSVSVWQAFVAESVGTFVLMFMILWLTTAHNISKFTPILIGLTVAALISLLAPISQGGFNPARDFAPRVFSYFVGWQSIVFQAPKHSFFTVYILGPICGASVAAFIFKLLKSIR